MLEYFKIPECPYGLESLDRLNTEVFPQFLSNTAIAVHFHAHHRFCYEQLNRKISEDPKWIKKSLEEVIQQADGDLLHYAAESYNHDFYWKGIAPSSEVRELKAVKRVKTWVMKSFDHFSDLKNEFIQASRTLHSGGWLWLVYNPETARISVEFFCDRDHPLRHGLRPLLACDLWEHSYYLEFLSDREKFIQLWWNHIQWNFVAYNLERLEAELDSRESFEESLFYHSGGPS